MVEDPYQEMLDDPGLPFEQRWALISEIDRTNGRFGIYRTFIADWNAWLDTQSATEQGRLSVFEVGSGSGGLSREIGHWGRQRGLGLDLHLYDAQADVLAASLEQFTDNAKPKVHVATDAHLEVFPDKAFDYVISLHVMHHIRPFSMAVSAMEQMLRIARRGVFIIDFENKPWAVSFARIWNRLSGVSPTLSSDGIKSLKRAYAPGDVMRALSESEVARDFRLEMKRYPFVPYWRLRATRGVS